METQTKIKCSKCNYEWETHSELMNISCPSCQSKVPNPNFKKQLNKKRGKE